MQELVNKQRRFFNSNETKDINFRIKQLKKLKLLLQENEQRMEEAIYADFSKSAFDNYSTEIALLYLEINDAVKKIKKWALRKRVPTDLVNLPGGSYILPEPLGVSLIIGAWNYPYQLSFAPAIAAIAAGNTVILKPSELPANTSRLMAEIVNQNFEPEFFRVVEGGVVETQQLLKQRFDKIFFTGSVPVGRIVYQAAAKHLTPVTLELGGKSPAFILDDKNLNMYVKRLVWAKFVNAGQTCIAPDYILVKRSLKDKFIQQLVAEIKKEQFSIENQNYVQIINEKNMKRLIDYINQDKVVFGGNYDMQTRVIEPTVMDEVSFDDAVMQEEIFGPILPVIPFDSLDEMIAEVKRREKPLSCYVFTRDKKLRNKIMHEVSFGGGCVNDAIMHISNNKLPFGGVGESGIGSYHGEFGFRTFSHYKSILDKPTWFEAGLKYFPHSAAKFNLMKKMLR
ncbi:NAD(P)-dependent benzaldehyde dehydrogenase [bioreactor metagenome]|jgi:aldehyde dehydrogenase (NAD+)|uniref:NAD(P)-dependent benzaldehyde dehydrogenase n=1 Tax=bioreactor metagenome TaxID=1076179 RepID=A0A644V828_9ZZZZ|nr:aldehyde dehydrogenase [Paludibacter sp.]